MKSVRILTLNVQMFPALGRTVQGDLSIFGLALSIIQDILPETLTKWIGEPSADVVARAGRIADALNTVPTDELPDVLLFNELFNEDGRDALVSQLKDTWPHSEAKFAETDLEEDAGLAILSRLPFMPIDGTKTSKAVFYDQDAGDDAWSSKGAALVKVAGPLGPLTIITTHLQSSYDFETQHRAERSSQLDQIVKLFVDDDDLSGGVTVIGDLNIVGRPDPLIQSDEWEDLFANGSGSYGKLLYDSWVQMAPLGRRDLWDNGYSNRNTEDGIEKRLDYHCLLRPSPAPEIVFNEKALVVHHARVLHRNLSDHNAVEGVYQRWYPHCQPASAIDVDKDAEPKIFREEASNTARSSVTAVPVNIKAEDGYFWLYLGHAGTYSMWASENLELKMYAHDNVSDAISPSDSVKYEYMGSNLGGRLMGLARNAGDPGLPSEGVTVASRFPLLIAVRPRADAEGKRRAGRGVVGIVEHRGDTKETAIRLVPHQTIDLPFPPDQPLGLDDRCWLVLDAVQTLSPKLRSENVEFAAAGGLSLELMDDSGGVIASELAPADATTALSFEVLGGERCYVTVKRADRAVGHQATYRTPISYLRLDRALGVHVDDETGADWGGADEPTFQFYLDDAQLLSTQWDDADTGEEWPNLQFDIRQAAEATIGATRAVPYADAIAGTFDETDGILTPARGVNWFFIDPLPAGQIEQKYRSSLTVTDAFKDGQYTFFCTISRDP